MTIAQRLVSRVQARQFANCNLQFAVCNRRLGRAGFTLVELLVVITIIGILVSLITVAAAGALKRAREAEIKVELDQLSGAFETYRDTNGSYPPNCQVDGAPSTDTPLDDVQVLSDVRRHLKQVSSRHKEPEELIAALAGLTTNGAPLPAGQGLQGGMTAGEAIVFWLGGFSADPKYPISGDGGPSYDVTGVPVAERRLRDPLQRKWVIPLEIARLGPKDTDGFFPDPTAGIGGTRFIEYTLTINGVTQTRRINFWQYSPRKSQQPYLYFDVSRHPAAVIQGGANLGPFDPPAATALTGIVGPNGELGVHVHAVKTLNSAYSTATAANVPPIVFANPDKFQILHAGVDDEWGEEAFELMSVHGVVDAGRDPSIATEYLPYPVGPYTGEIADTIVNFSPATLEKSQP